MSQAAEIAAQQSAGASQPIYEQPLNERMRTFLRLEFLYRQLCYQAELNSAWASRDAIDGLLDIVAILSRGDVRGDVLKELERQLFMLERLQKTNEVDITRLQGVTQKLKKLRGSLSAIGPKYLQELKDNEFLNAIRHRSSIPGGTCAFDIPEYTHWLRQNFDRRTHDVAVWVEAVRPLCDAVMGLLWIVRNTKQSGKRIASGGVYQHSMNRETINGLIRIALPAGVELYPEISGSQHRFSVRFMRWDSGEEKPAQTGDDVEFELTIC
jgi:cell division protein ZapD